MSECNPIKEFEKKLCAINPPNFSVENYNFRVYPPKEVHITRKTMTFDIGHEIQTTAEINFIASNYDLILTTAKEEKEAYEKRIKIEEERARQQDIREKCMRKCALARLKEKVCK